MATSLLPRQVAGDVLRCAYSRRGTGGSGQSRRFVGDFSGCSTSHPEPPPCRSRIEGLLSFQEALFVVCPCGWRLQSRPAVCPRAANCVRLSFFYPSSPAFFNERDTKIFLVARVAQRYALTSLVHSAKAYLPAARTRALPWPKSREHELCACSTPPDGDLCWKDFAASQGRPGGREGYRNQLGVEE